MTDLIPYRQSAVSLYDIPPSEVPQTDITTYREWIRSKESVHTKKAYRRDVKAFYVFLQEKRLLETPPSIASATIEDVQDYADYVKATCKQVSTQARKLAAIKSLLTFAQKIGFTPFNVGWVQKLPRGKNKLAERILTHTEVVRLIDAAREHKRDHLLLLVLYGSGIREEELCNLQWRDVQETANGGQITVFGKRDETRSIPLHAAIWQQLQDFKTDQQPDDFVFQSQERKRKGTMLTGRLSETQVWRIVKKYAEKAGVPDASTHWLRHSHATHALDNKAPLKLVQETLGHSSLATTGRYTHVRPEDSTSYYLKLD